MKELRIEELTTEQKLGLVTIAYVSDDEGELDYIVELAKNHSLGAAWVNPGMPNTEEAIRRIKEAADYPVLIMCDAEDGIGDYHVGRHNAISRTGSLELAYLFGKAVGVSARQVGYNVVCNPLLDIVKTNAVCGMTDRSLGPDKQLVTAYARQIAKGMHDGGVLTVGKHYPGATENEAYIDSHMAETSSDMTKEELLEENLYPYIQLNNEGLLDGIMTKHARFARIDPDYPASLSRKLISIIREEGFEGISLTDALVMHGVTSKFGKGDCIGLSVGNGNDLALAFNRDNHFAFGAMREGYEKGLISDERLDEAVRRILEAQHKTLGSAEYTELSSEEKASFERFSTDGITLTADEGICPTVSRDGKHFFIILSEKKFDANNTDELDLDTFSHFWHSPVEIANRIKEVFPNSGVGVLTLFPTISDNMYIMRDQYDYDDIVFVSYFYGRPCMGKECLSARVLTVLDSLQVTNRISAVVHYGNPFVLEDFPHVPRVLCAPGSKKASLAAIDVLAGLYPPKGVKVYDVKLK